MDGDISVIPEPVKEDSITTKGMWDSFNITWSPCRNVNYGTVFYEVKIDSDIESMVSMIIHVFQTHYGIQMLVCIKCFGKRLKRLLI